MNDREEWQERVRDIRATTRLDDDDDDIYDYAIKPNQICFNIYLDRE